MRLNEQQKKMVTDYMPLVRAIVRELWPSLSGADLEDRIADGYVILCDAVADYRPSRGRLATRIRVRVRGLLIQQQQRAMRAQPGCALPAIVQEEDVGQ